MFTLSHGFHKGTYKCLRWVTVFTMKHTRFSQRNIQLFTSSHGFHNETYKIFTKEHTNVCGESRVKETHKCLRSVRISTKEHTYVYVESRFLQRNIQTFTLFTLSHGFHKGTYMCLRCLRWVMVFTKEHTYVYVESRFSQRNIHMFTLSHDFHKGTYMCLRWVTVFTKEKTNAKSDQWTIHTEVHNRSKRCSFKLIRNDRLDQ